MKQSDTPEDIITASLHAGGQGFESPQLHHVLNTHNSILHLISLELGNHYP